MEQLRRKLREIERLTLEMRELLQEQPQEKPKKKKEPDTGDWAGVFPAGSSRKSKTDQGRIKVLKNNRKMIYIGKWFGRKEATLWSVYEARALKQLEPSREDVIIMDKYRAIDNEFHRGDIGTLLNNWSGEMDRARTCIKPASVGNIKSEDDGPDGWQEAFTYLFEGLPAPSLWSAVDSDWRKQITEHLKGGLS